MYVELTVPGRANREDRDGNLQLLMVLENPNATRFAPIDKLKMTKFRGDGEEIANSASESEPLTTTVNGQQTSFTYDCGYQYDDGSVFINGMMQIGIY